MAICVTVRSRAGEELDCVQHAQPPQRASPGHAELVFEPPGERSRRQPDLGRDGIEPGIVGHTVGGDRECTTNLG